MADVARYPFLIGARGCPSAEYARRREHDPAGWVETPAGDQVRLAVRYEDAVFVLSDPRFSRELDYEGAPKVFEGFDVGSLPGGLLSSDGPVHARLRRLLSGTFTARKVDGWRDRVHARVNEFVDDLPGEFDVVSRLAFPLPLRVICDVMGVPGIDFKLVHEWSTAMLSTSSLPPEARAKAFVEFIQYTAELVEESRKLGGDGLLASMIEARDQDDRLSEEELVNLTLAIFLAGHETTAAMLSRVILHLLDPRSGYEALVERPHLIPATLDELLRVEALSEAPLVRVALEEVRLPSGHVVGKGEGVLAAIHGANFDPSVFPDPHAVDLDRETNQHLTFGRGPHNCLGANMARMELREALAVLVERLPGLSLAEPADDVPWEKGSIIYRPLRVMVRT